MYVEGIILEGPFLYDDLRKELRRFRNGNAVYLITSLDGSLKYVGSSSNVQARMSQHHYQFRRGSHPKTVLQKAYDRDTGLLYYFKLYPSEMLAIRAEDAILKALHGSEGFTNVALDASRAWIRGDNYIDPRTGVERTDELKQAISSTRKRLFAEGKLVNHTAGRPLSEETRAKISEGHKRLHASGYTVSEETRRKLSEHRQKGKHNLAKRCVVEGVEYDCMASAAEATGIKYPTLYKRIGQGKPGYRLVG